MSRHSHSRILVHFVWGTHNHQKLMTKELRFRLNDYLGEYATNQDVRRITSYVNIDHVHFLADIPTSKSIADIVKLLKGASSRWINQQDDQWMKFAWGRGYGAFSVSESTLKQVILYINNQKEHHRNRTFREEYDLFIERYHVELGNR